MVLRAMFGSAVVVGLMGLAPNVPIFIIMRFIQGTLSGTLSAASALVSSITPRDKRPFAMGLLMTAGSDFHGKTVKPDVELGAVDGSHEDLVARLKEYHKTGGNGRDKPGWGLRHESGS